jgi:hypothetical protein
VLAPSITGLVVTSKLLRTGPAQADGPKPYDAEHSQGKADFGIFRHPAQPERWILFRDSSGLVKEIVSANGKGWWFRVRRVAALGHLRPTDWRFAAILMAMLPVSAGAEHGLIAKTIRTIDLETNGAPRVLTLVQLYIMRPGADGQACRALLDWVQDVSRDPIGKRECVDELGADMLPALERQPVPRAYSLSYCALYPATAAC